MNKAAEIKSYKYYMMGLNILSEIELPGLISTSDTFDVKIILNKFNVIEKDSQENRNYFILKNLDFVCNFINVAKFKITGGNLIQVDLCEQADMELANVYLLGICMGVLLIQKEMVAMHGSSIVIDNQAVIITGRCGAGKSALSAALRLKGYKILSDDISPVMALDSGEIMSAPAFPRQRICHDTAVKLGIDINKLEKACTKDMKYNVDISVEFLKHPIELFGIIQVMPGDVEDVVLTKLNSLEKLELIKSNIFCKELFSQIDFPPSFFKKVINLAKKVHTYQLKRPEGRFTTERQIEVIVEEIARVTNGVKQLT
jgi:hypothetical protein